MFYTYVLLCEDYNWKRMKFYVGTTQNFQERVIAHKSKSIETTKSFNAVKLVYYECCLDKTDSIRRERQLKTGFGRGYIKKRIDDYLKSLRV